MLSFRNNPNRTGSIDEYRAFPLEVGSWARHHRIPAAGLVEVQLTIVSGTDESLSPNDIRNLAGGIASHLSNTISRKLAAIGEEKSAGIVFIISGVNGVNTPAIGEKIKNAIHAGLQMGGINHESIPKFYFYNTPLSMILLSDLASPNMGGGYITMNS